MLLQIIVDSHKNISNTIKESFASSLRCDGSVDITQVDKIFIMLKVIDKNAHEQLFFLGAKNPKKQVLLVVSTLSKTYSLTQRLG